MLLRWLRKSVCVGSASAQVAVAESLRAVIDFGVEAHQAAHTSSLAPCVCVFDWQVYLIELLHIILPTTSAGGSSMRVVTSLLTSWKELDS